MYLIKEIPVFIGSCMKDFITVANYNYTTEYVVLKMLLQQEEIPFVFLNETSASILPITFCGKGGIRLQVHKKDRDKVLKIISDLDKDASLDIV